MKRIFNFEDIENFDEHISCSIPNYSGLVQVFKSLALDHMCPEGLCVDLGCSTGSFLYQLPKHLGATYKGIDLVNMIRNSQGINFIKSDCLTYLSSETSPIDVIVSMFTLQFLSTRKRSLVISELQRYVSSGSVLLISEKVYLDDPHINHCLHRDHLESKRSYFTDTQLLDKDYDLLGSMHCQRHSVVLSELESIGVVTPIWQSFNFIGWIVT